MPPLRNVVLLSLALAVLAFTVLWIGSGYALGHFAYSGWAPLDWLIRALGALAVLALTWLLFPAIVTLSCGFFLDRVAAAVEALDYPWLGPARPQSISEILRVTLRLMALTIVLNLLALPVYLLAPGANLFVFLGINGYLLGLEYFEVVALRRLDRGMASALRRQYGARVFVGGIIIAGVFAVPLVNLVAPVIATAFMVHVFQGLRAAPQSLAWRSR